MSDIVEPDARGNFSLFVKNVKEENELLLRGDFGQFGLLAVHRPNASPNLFLRFPSKEDAESALRNMKKKYNVVPVDGRKAIQRAEEKKGGFQKRSSSRPGRDSTGRNDCVKNNESPRGVHEDKKGGFQKRSSSRPGRDSTGGNECVRDDKSPRGVHEDKKGGFRNRSSSRPGRDSTGRNECVRDDKSTRDFQKEERPFPRKDSGISKGFERNSSGRGRTGRKCEENDVTELEDGINGIVLSTKSPHRRDLRTEEADGPPPSLHARHPESRNYSSNLPDDTPPQLIPVNNLENRGIPRLVPAKDFQNGSPDSPSLATSANNFLRTEFDDLPRLVPCGDGPNIYSIANTTKDLPAFTPDFHVRMQKHANEMYIGNISEDTSVEDIMEVFASLNPVSVSSIKYTDINQHIPYRVVKFSTAQAVTYALMYYQYYYFHGKYWDLTRRSTLIEMTPECRVSME